MARARRISRLLDEFHYYLQGKTIAEHFQIKHSSYTLTRLEEDKFAFRIVREDFPKCTFDLPIELSMKIIGYLYERTDVLYHIHFTNDYPFKPPIWSMQTILPPPLYEHALYVLKYRYDRGWSPAITIEKDLLNMISCIESMH